MKKALFCLFLFCFSISSPLFAKEKRAKNDNGEVKVRSYYKKDGTFVPEHYRTSPNETKNDNWSTKGNINPYTGEEGTKEPDTGFVGQSFFDSPLKNDDARVLYAPTYRFDKKQNKTRFWRVQPRLSYISKVMTRDIIPDLYGFGEESETKMRYATPEIMLTVGFDEIFGVDVHFVYHHKKDWSFFGNYFKGEFNNFKIQTQDFEVIASPSANLGNDKIRFHFKPGIGLRISAVKPTLDKKIIGTDNPHVNPFISLEAGLSILEKVNIYARTQSGFNSLEHQIYGFKKDKKYEIAFSSTATVIGIGVNL